MSLLLGRGATKVLRWRQLGSLWKNGVNLFHDFDVVYVEILDGAPPSTIFNAMRETRKPLLAQEEW